MKVALVYDRVNKWGGAERVLLALHQIFPNAPLYTSVYNPKTAPWAKVFPKIFTSFLQGVPLRTHHEILAPLMPLAFESFSFDQYDIVISITSEAAKGVVTKPKTIHVCYCLTPTRYLWSAYKDYFTNPVFRILSEPVASYLRTWDKMAAQRPDMFIAISKEVQNRIRKYYGRESEVIYPPVMFSAEVAHDPPKATQLLAGVGSPRHDITSRYTLDANGYFLIVSRLVPYKRIDIAIKTFNKLGWPLKIVGTGSDFTVLKRMARTNVEFLGNLTDDDLSRYYEDCIALIVPGIEDFGLATVEAQAFGKPVIAFRGGGSLETIIERKTGEFFHPQTVKSLISVLKKFKASKYKSEDCIKNVMRFSKERFKKEFMKIIKQ